MIMAWLRLSVSPLAYSFHLHLPFEPLDWSSQLHLASLAVTLEILGAQWGCRGGFLKAIWAAGPRNNQNDFQEAS